MIICVCYVVRHEIGGFGLQGILSLWLTPGRLAARLISVNFALEGPTNFRLWFGLAHKHVFDVFHCIIQIAY